MELYRTFELTFHSAGVQELRCLFSIDIPPRWGGESRPGNSPNKRLVRAAHPTTFARDQGLRETGRGNLGFLSRPLCSPLIPYESGRWIAPYNCEIATGRSLLRKAGSPTYRLGADRGRHLVMCSHRKRTGAGTAPLRDDVRSVERISRGGLSLTERLVSRSVGVAAVFHGVDQQVGHEPVDVGRSSVSQQCPAIDFSRLHRAHVIFAVVDDG